MATFGKKGEEKPAKVCHLLAHRKMVSVWVTRDDGERYVLRLSDTETDYLRTLLTHGVGSKKKPRKSRAKTSEEKRPCKKWLGRPPVGAQEVLRLNGEEWEADDGKPGIAFSGRVGTLPYSWHNNCECNQQGCPRNRASSFTAKRYGAANGYPMAKPAG